MKITGNEPAYPMANPLNAQELGLTIRQQFAMAAMTGILSSWNHDSMPEENGIKLTAECSVKCADALINELNKTEL